MSYEDIREKIDRAEKILKSIQTIDHNLDLLDDSEIEYIGIYTDEDSATTERVDEDTQEIINEYVVDKFIEKMIELKSSLEVELEEIMGEG